MASAAGGAAAGRIAAAHEARNGSSRRNGTGFVVPPHEHSFDRKLHVDEYYKYLRELEDKSAAEPKGLTMQKVWQYGMGVVVAVNVFLVALEVDYGVNHEAPMDDKIGWVILEIVFTLIFTVEMIVGLYIERVDVLKWFRDAWNLFDLLLVAISYLMVIASFVDVGSESLKMLKMLRVLRFTRFVRLIKVVHGFKSTFIVVMAWWASMKSVLQVYVIMMLGLFFYATLATALLGNSGDEDVLSMDLGDGVTVEDKFGNIPSSMYTLFQLMTLQGFETTTRPIVKAYPYMFFYFATYVMMFSFGLLNMLVGLVVSKTIGETTRLEEEYRQMAMSETILKLRSVYDACDVDQIGSISFEEFDGTIQGQGEVRKQLEESNLPPIDTLDLFNIADTNANGSLTREEFVVGCYKLHDKGGEISALAARAAVRRLGFEIKEILNREKQIELMESAVCQALQLPSEGMRSTAFTSESITLKTKESPRGSHAHGDHAAVPASKQNGPLGPALRHNGTDDKPKEPEDAVHCFKPKELEDRQELHLGLHDRLAMNTNFELMKEEFERLRLQFAQMKMPSKESLKEVVNGCLDKRETHMKRIVEGCLKDTLMRLPENQKDTGKLLEKIEEMEVSVAELGFHHHGSQTPSRGPTPVATPSGSPRNSQSGGDTSKMNNGGDTPEFFGRGSSQYPSSDEDRGPKIPRAKALASSQGPISWFDGKP